MSGKMLGMSKQAEVRRMKLLGMTERAIARSLRCSRNTVRKYLDEPETDVATAGASASSPAVENKAIVRGCAQSAIEAEGWANKLDWAKVLSEVASGTPLYVLWEERCETGEVPVQYPGFWKQLYRRYPNVGKSMHRVFAPGSRIEIDYCDGIDLLDLVTGEIIETELFVGVLCYSRYAFAEFTLSQSSADFLTSHVRMFEWFGGVTPIVSPDNLKSAVSRTHRYDPEINPAYTKLASHYGFAVVPARVRTPKDKAIVERTIQIFQRWFFFRVRHRTFTSLIELNQVLREHLIIFHAKQHRIFRRTRAEMFDAERTALQALPADQYQVATHVHTAPHPDCHLVFEKNYYSAPYTLRGQELDVWATAQVVEIYNKGERVAFHARRKGHGHFATDKLHYPPEHQAYCEATPAFVREQAARIGDNTAKLINGLLSGPYPLQYLRRAQGIVRLSKPYGVPSLEAACIKANRFGQTTYAFIERVLKNGQADAKAADAAGTVIQRGPNPLLRGEKLLH